MLFSRSRDPKSNKKRLYILLVELALALALMLFLFLLATNLGGGRATNSIRHDPLAYYDESAGFSLRLPDSTWKVTPIALRDSLPNEAAFASLREAAKTVVQLSKMRGDSLSAYAEVGVFRPQPPRAALALAYLSLQQIRERFRTERDTVAVIAPVTPVTSKIMDGAFFVVEVPNASLMPEFTVWVFTYIARRDRVFVIHCKTRNNDYNRLRDELAQVIADFRLL